MSREATDVMIGAYINAEGKSLETVTKPLTPVPTADDKAPSLAVPPAAPPERTTAMSTTANVIPPRTAQGIGRWHAMPSEARRRLILRALGDDRLTITELATRMTSQHPELMRFTYPVLYRVVRPMLDSGELSRHSEPWRTRTRSFVSRPAPPPKE